MAHRYLKVLVQCLGLAAALVGCGGGDTVSPSAQQSTAPMPRLESAHVQSELCTKAALWDGRFQLVDGQCVRGNTALRLASAGSGRAGGSAPTATALTADTLMDWAEFAYPQFFASSRQTTLFSSPYTYRYYPGTQNYLGLAGEDIYVLGPMSGNQLARVGTMADFKCNVVPQSCSAPGIPTIVSATAGDRSATIAFTPPASAGGSSITAYNATCSAGFTSILTVSAASSPIVVTGMTNDQAYKCTVSATNGAGTGGLSASLSVTPTAPVSTVPTPVTQHTSISLVSDSGDYIGIGGNYNYTPANANITVNASNGLISVSVAGNQDWSGTFKLPTGVNTFQTGNQYTGLARYPFNDPAKGGLSWYGEGRGCNTLTGSFTVDGATYANGSLDSIIMHFEQHCEGGLAALRGQIQWTSHDTTVPAGPVNPPPAGLWSAASGSVPATGNYVYFQSDAGDYIGQGGNYTYTGSQISTSQNGGGVSVNINAGTDWWYTTFQPMQTVNPLQRGYYGNLQRYPFHNPATGGLTVSGNGRGCNTLTGWFVVDDVAYTSGTLSLLKLRFEQHCEGGTTAMRGQISWAR